MFDAIALHAYWSTAGLTRWNALRWRLFPRPGLPILVTECGRDRVRDGEGGTYLPSEHGDAFGWQAQGISGDAFLAELRAYDAELRADGAYGVVYTTSPDDEWARKGFGVDDLADRCDFTNLGPHDLEGRSPQALAWAARAPIVKSVDQTAAIRRARPDAIAVYRRRFSPVQQDAMLDRVRAGQVADAAGSLAGAIIAGLDGFRHPNLYAELLNEVGRDRREDYLRLAREAAPLLRAAGVKVAGPSWATGDYEKDDWTAFTAAAAPPPAPIPAPPPRPIPPQEPTMPDWCPFALVRPIQRNFTPGRAGRRIELIVDHIADGLGSPWGWFNRVPRDENDGSSAPFWVSRAGEIEQYVRLGDTAWANGPKCKPDLTNPIIKRLVDDGMVGMNSVSVAIEHEGHPGQPLTPAQLAASRRLHRWLSEVTGVPLDRTHVVGHYQIDRCSRANCPGPTHPWAAILAKETPMPDPTPKPVDYEAVAWGPIFRAHEALQKTGDQADAALAQAVHNATVLHKLIKGGK